MSIPYEAELKTNPDGQIRLYTRPINELDILKGEQYLNVEDILVDESMSNILYGIEDNCFEINMECSYSDVTSGKFGFNVRKSENDYISIYYDISSNQMVVDQSRIKVAKTVDSMKIAKPKDNKLKIRILVDVGGIDVIVNDGEAAISTIYFSNNDQKEMEFFVNNCEVNISSIVVNHLYSIYHKNGREVI